MEHNAKIILKIESEIDHKSKIKTIINFHPTKEKRNNPRFLIVS